MKNSPIYAFKNNIFIIMLIWKVSRKRIIWSFIKQLSESSLRIFIAVFYIRIILNGMQSNKDFSYFIYFFVVSTCIFILNAVIVNVYNNRIVPITNQIIYKRLNAMLYQKATDVELACFENPEFFNQYTKAATEANTRAIAVLDNFTGLIGAIWGAVGMSAVLINLDLFVVLFIVIPLFGNFWLGKRISKLRYELDMENVSPTRKKDYVKRIVYLQNYSKEIRLTNIFNVLKASFDEAVEELVSNTKAFGLRIALTDFFITALSFYVPFLATSIYSLYRIAVSKTIMIGDYSVLSIGVINLTQMIRSIIDRSLEIYKNSLYIENLKSFLDYTPQISESQEGLGASFENILQLKNVSFKYEGQTNSTLSNISFDIKKGEKIAIVGHNGAGKSTLIKLIMRLYDVTGGEILLDKANIKQYSVKSYRSLFATVFQDYKVFSASIAENVFMREVAESEKEAVDKALRFAGVYDKVATLKNGNDSYLTKEFDENGTVLSGGEQQKIAIARVFASGAELIILDEPSSALDPVSEYKMYETMMAVAKGKTVLFISHRLSSATVADTIYMFENGEIIERGSHSELMKLNGAYAKMFHQQAESYLKDGDKA